MKPFKFLSKNDLGPYGAPDGFEVIGVTPILYNPENLEPVRGVLYRNTETGATVRGPMITPDSELWNFNDEETIQ